MSNTKHTPGPWHAGADGLIGRAIDVRCGKQGIVAKSWHGPNARLIAAAPELLEACEAMLAELDQQHHGFGEQEIQMRAAIAKAKGESK